MKTTKRKFKLIAGGLVIILFVAGGVFGAKSLQQDDITLTKFRHASPPINNGGVLVRIEQSTLSFTTAMLVTTGNVDLFNGTEPDKNGFETFTKYKNEIFGGPEDMVWSYPAALEATLKQQRYCLIFKPTVCQILPSFVSNNLSFAQSCKTPKYIELIRQSPAHLATIGMNKADGYTIAGRTNLTLPTTIDLAKQASLSYEPMETLPNLIVASEIRDQLNTDNPTVLEAVRLASIFYTQPIRIGSAGIARTQFNALPIKSRLDLVWSGQSAFQCAGMRDMWLEMAASSTLIPKVRRVGAYNYFPPFKGLVPYSHALAEFWVPEWGKWVGIDPWFGFMFRLDGRLLSATELMQLSSTEKQRMEMLPTTPMIRQYTQSLDGKKPYSSLTVKEAAPPLLSPNWQDGTGTYNMGYLDYFNAVDFGEELSAKGQNGVQEK